jgi:hypothetical protein
LKYNDNGECLVREFGVRAFSNHKYLNSFVVPSCITKLGEWVFYNTPIKSLVVHSNVTEMGKYCFAYSNELLTVRLETTHISEENLLSYCRKLTNVELSNIATIPDSMFATCSSLKHIDIPDTVTSFGSYAFSNSGLTSITIPENVRTIGSNCFLGCTALGNIDGLPITAPSLGTEVFGNGDSNYTGSKATNKTIHVPKDSSGYEAGYWKSILQDKVGFTLYKDL